MKRKIFLSIIISFFVSSIMIFFAYRYAMFRIHNNTFDLPIEILPFYLVSFWILYFFASFIGSFMLICVYVENKSDLYIFKPKNRKSFKTKNDIELYKNVFYDTQNYEYMFNHTELKEDERKGYLIRKDRSVISLNSLNLSDGKNNLE